MKTTFVLAVELGSTGAPADDPVARQLGDLTAGGFRGLI
jgi:hypothetical protein